MKTKIIRGNKALHLDVLKVRANELERLKEDRPQTKPARKITLLRSEAEWQAIREEARRKWERMYIKGAWT